MKNSHKLCRTHGSIPLEVLLYFNEKNLTINVLAVGQFHVNFSSVKCVEQNIFISHISIRNIIL
jgi:hypothetical protein